MSHDIPVLPTTPVVKFNIPSFHEYSFLKTYQYTIQQLKDMCLFYNIKQSGNKKELYIRIYNFLFCSFHIIKIQKVWKGFLQRICNKLRGPAFYNYSLCVNETDFLTFEPLNDISIHYFYSFKENNVIYGCDIKSIYEWIKHSTVNPYTRIEFNNSTIDNLHKLILISRLLHLNLEIIHDYSIISYSSKIIQLLSIVNSYGYYTNVDWILSLGRNELIRLLRELFNIWNFKLKISSTIKQNICPPRGKPFVSIDLDNIIHDNITNVKKYTISVLTKFITSGINQEYRYLGSTYVLMALTSINQNVALSYPWLYESFI